MMLRIGTRGSALARAQATDVARRLEAHGHSTETIIISTEGDRVTDRGFTEVGAFGIFVREIEAALLDGRVDVAVHSYKDLPSRSPDGLVIAAVPERVDVADVLLTRPIATAAERGMLPLRDGAQVGTSAARRQALLRSLRPDLEIGMLRGNVPTRVRALARWTIRRNRPRGRRLGTARARRRGRDSARPRRHRANPPRSGDIRSRTGAGRRCSAGAGTGLGSARCGAQRSMILARRVRCARNALRSHWPKEGAPCHSARGARRSQMEHSGSSSHSAGATARCPVRR